MFLTGKSHEPTCITTTSHFFWKSVETSSSFSWASSMLRPPCGNNSMLRHNWSSPCSDKFRQFDVPIMTAFNTALFPPFPCASPESGGDASRLSCCTVRSFGFESLVTDMDCRSSLSNVASVGALGRTLIGDFEGETGCVGIDCCVVLSGQYLATWPDWLHLKHSLSFGQSAFTWVSLPQLWHLRFGRLPHSWDFSTVLLHHRQ